MKRYDVIVVGAGHAGIEAALASARMGRRTLCVTMRLDRIGHLPCNCSIGGPAKGHMAREVDALGGQMGIAADHAMTHLRRVGTGRGPAVQTVRAHVCKSLYPKLMRATLTAQRNLDLLEGVVETVLHQNSAVGVRVVPTGSQQPHDIEARAIVLTTGTFLNGLCHEGQKKTVAARHGDQAATGLSPFLESIGIRLRRFKTGTTPRVRFSSLDLRETEMLESEPEAGSISFLHRGPLAKRTLLGCWQTWTNDAMHDLIRDRLHESAMYSGQIQGIGPRYCPSIEDKIVRFADKDRHPIFLEVEEWDGESVYVQGVSTSLPAETQLAMLRQVPGMRHVEMLRPGYAVEYDMADPLQLDAHLMSKELPGLFLAGQINGTSGYEEAAGQGIVAGINAARLSADEAPVDFPRDQSFIGVMIDDLVTKGVEDPYRMLTARAEHRLLLRHDNADRRLTPLAREIGLCSDLRWARLVEKEEAIARSVASLESFPVSLAQETEFADLGMTAPANKVSLFGLMRRPDVDLAAVRKIAERCGYPIELSDDPEVWEQLELAGMYAGYIGRQEKAADRARKLEELRIPETLDFASLNGLSYESREKLTRVRPGTIGQASRIPGVRMTDIALLIGHIRGFQRAG